MSKKILILYSGGLDSFVMRKLAHQKYGEKNTTCVFWDFGQPYAEKEKKALPDDVIIEKFNWLSKNYNPSGKEGSLSGNIIIDGRNMVLAIITSAKYLGHDEIWLGALLGEMHKQSTDKNRTFQEKINDLMLYVYGVEKAPKLVYPLADLYFNKVREVQWAYNNGVTVEQLYKTSSCLTAGDTGKCGQCVACFRRWGVFKQLGIPDYDYDIDPLKAQSNIKMALEMMKGEFEQECHYDEHRRDEIIPALHIALQTGGDKYVLLDYLDGRKQDGE